MTAATLATDAALYPPTVAPPAGPLPLWRFLPTFLRNPLRAIPAAVYEEQIFVPRTMRGRVAWVTDPALVERILLGEHERFPKSRIEKRIFSTLLGDSTLSAEGASWRWQRRTVAPLFRHADLLGQVPQMGTAAERTVARWRAQSSSRPREVGRDMTDVTFDVLEATLFAGATAAEAAILKREIGTYLERTSWDIALEILQIPAWVWHPAKGPMRRSAEIMSRTMGEVIERERGKGWPGGGLMARLGTARDPETDEPMPDAQVSHNLLTFAAAGHETTAKALTWALYLLARAPAWQERLRREARSVIGTGRLESGHIDRLTVTRQVIKEAMRLYPPAPVLGRMASEPVSLGGHTFAAGAMLVIPVYVIHRHRKLWEDPDRFDPDRFLPERENAYARTQFMPFGFGPRTCIGMSFAMIEAVALLAMLMRDVRVSCAAELAPEPLSRVTLRPRGGMPLTIEALSA